MEEGMQNVVMTSDNGAESESRRLINGAVQATTPQTEEMIKERKEKLRHLQKEAFQLANYYFVFQSVIFTSFYSGPHTKEDVDVRCKYRWVPIMLSSLAGVINLCALVGLAWRYYHTMAERDRFEAGNPAGSYAIPMRLRQIFWITCVFVSILCFIVFFGVTIAGCVQITCAHAATAAA